ncbi:MAG: acyltransferase domain-containing protein [Pseudomonadota bacterium]
MRTRLLLLCPGQGSQHTAMFELARSDARAAALLERLELPPLTGDIYGNRNAQPLIVAAALAMWEAVRPFAPAPALVAGYSIGELSAYGVAGALTPDDAIALAATRARLMDACLDTHPGQALLAIAGLPLARIGALVADRQYFIAIETAEDSCIAGGPAAALVSLEQTLAAAGARCTRLPVQVASHTPYMAPAVAPFAAALHATPFAPMQAPVLAGVDAVAVRGKAPAVEQLSRQLAETIHWQSCMDACAEAGITLALELGPGSALSRMLQARHPHIACRSVADFRSLAGVRAWLERESGHTT